MVACLATTPLPVLRAASLAGRVVPLARSSSAIASLAEPLAAAVASIPVVPRNAGCSVLLLVASVTWIKLCNLLSGSGLTSQYVSRKLVHMGSGPLFVLCWPLFSPGLGGQLAAMTVPILSVVRLLRAGRAAEGSEAGAELVRAISRSGDKREALEGPMVYTLVLLASTIFGWRSVVSVVAVCQMAIGDGMADLVGRRFGRHKWPKAIEKTGKKSIEGSAAFAGFAFLACLAWVTAFHVTGVTILTAAQVAPQILLISIVAALVELLPLGDDNLTVPLSSALLAAILLNG